jgi:hypothetical protein
MAAQLVASGAVLSSTELENYDYYVMTKMVFPMQTASVDNQRLCGS